MKRSARRQRAAEKRQLARLVRQLAEAWELARRWERERQQAADRSAILFRRLDDALSRLRGERAEHETALRVMLRRQNMLVWDNQQLQERNAELAEDLSRLRAGMGA